MDCVILRLGPCLFAVPVDDISEIVKPQDVDLVDISADESSEMMRLRGQYISIRRLDEFYGVTDLERKPLSQMARIVFQKTLAHIAVPVDEVVDRQQVVLKPLVGALSDVRASWDCALLGTDELAVVLDGELIATGEEK